jgi:hypothetical protein
MLLGYLTTLCQMLWLHSVQFKYRGVQWISRTVKEATVENVEVPLQHPVCCDGQRRERLLQQHICFSELNSRPPGYKSALTLDRYFRKICIYFADRINDNRMGGIYSTHRKNTGDVSIKDRIITKLALKSHLLQRWSTAPYSLTVSRPTRCGCHASRTP